MANSTTNLDTIATAQAQKEVTANALADAGSPATLFGRRASVCTGLTWGFYGGVMLVDGALTAISNGTVTLTASNTNYVEASRAGVVTANTTGFSAGAIPLYQIVVGAAAVTSYTDYRAWAQPEHIAGKAAVSMTSDADKTLSAAEARCALIEITSTVSLTATRNVIVPAGPQVFAVRNATTGGQRLTVKTSAGTGVVVANGARVALYSDGTNVVPLTSGQPGQVQVIAYAASITPDAAAGERVIVGTLTGGLTINAPSNPVAGAALEFAFAQDATGGRAITWNAAFKKAADGAGTASQRGATRFIYDGTNWLQTGGALVWA